MDVESRSDMLLKSAAVHWILNVVETQRTRNSCCVCEAFTDIVTPGGHADGKPSLGRARVEWNTHSQGHTHRFKGHTIPEYHRWKLELT